MSQPLASSSQLLLGVDAGGTKTRALLATRGVSGRFCIQGLGKSGAGNPLGCGFDAAMKSIRSAIDEALRGLASPLARPQQAVVAVAGAADQAIRRQLSEGLQSTRLADAWAVVPDYEPFLSLAGLGEPCVGVIAGTGSVAFARTADGEVFRAGGWGHLLGDEGSGYAIGRRALQLLLTAFENGDEPPLFQDEVFSVFGVESAAELPKAVYQAGDRRREIAAVAEFVLHAVDKDPLAREVVRLECGLLASVIIRAARLADLPKSGLSICLGGGVATSSLFFRTALLKELEEQGFPAARPFTLRDPAEACLGLAAMSFDRVG